VTITLRIIAGFILLVTGSAKLVSVFGDAQLLDSHDGLIYFMNYRQLFIAVGIIEVLSAFYVFLGRNETVAFGLICGLAFCFLTYRLCLNLLKIGGQCRCLGNLSDALGLSPRVTSILLDFSLGTLLFIGCLKTLHLLFVRRMANNIREDNASDAWGAFRN